MFLLQVLGNVFSVFAIVMLIVGALIVISVVAIAVFVIISVAVNRIEEDKENNNLWQEKTRRDIINA